MAAGQLSIEGYSDIADFYKGRSIFITGASGFMGKVLVERLLSACPGVDRLYLLLRQKRDVPPHKRLQQMKESAVFDNVRHTNPTQLDKLEVIEGDITKPDLGLSSAALDTLKSVSMIFHTAATVKFDEELKMAVALNVLAPSRLMELAKQLPQLDAFVHVSTAYCNCDRRVVEEKVYPAPTDLDEMLALCDLLPKELLADITDKYIGERPNTYTFTKAMGEHAVLRHSGQFPVAIFRPTIVCASLSRPFPGWVDAFSGPTGLIVGAGKGLIRTMHCNKDYIADIIPVDMAIDTLIAVGWQTAIDRSLDVKVYNCGTGQVNPIKWAQYEIYLRNCVRNYPLDNALWYPGGGIQKNKYLNKIKQILLETLPAYIIDYTAWLLGIKMSMSLIKVNQKISMALTVLEFFSTNEWIIMSDNVQKLAARLTPGDAKLFNLNPRTIEWDQYMANYIIGTRKYLLKEKDQDIEKAKKRIRRLFFLHYGIQYAIMIIFLRLILMNSETTRKIVYGTSRMLMSLFSNAYNRLVTSS